jgi:basic membrane lipoprotein Med (substrate-binding protein (PBP1-ABC) superfamily)
MQEDYIAARRLGMKEMRQALFEQRSPYPKVLDDIIKGEGKLSEISVGLIEIPLHMIDGTKTEGRTSAFAANFMPILQPDTEFSRKWSDLYDSQLEEGIRDPIKVYEYMTRFYVEEGNKRVSVSSYVGATAIHANVIRMMPKKADTKEYRVYREFLEYFNVCRMYDVIFTEEGSYRKFAALLGQTMDKTWPKEVLEEIKASYAVFEQCYHNKGGIRHKVVLPCGDAFLVYLNFYSIQSLTVEPRTVLENRIGRLWKEFLVDANEEGIALVENPEELENGKTGLGTALIQMLTPKEHYSQDNPLHMAFVYPKSSADSGWIYGHELGRNSLETHFNGLVKTRKYENCSTNEEVRAAIDDAIENHAEMILTISPTQMDETLRSAIHFPQVKFLNCSVNLSHNAVRTYYGRMHEAKFIMGAIAASVASNHKIGYVADYPIYGIVAGINAFAIGAAIIDPKAKIHLKWSTDKETDWRKDFEEEGVYVISGPDLIRPRQASREYGIYQRDMDGTVTNLAAPVWNWGTFYELIAQNVLDGNWNSAVQDTEDRAINYWWGMSAGVIDVILSEKLPYYSKKLVNMFREGIVSGRIRPFMGELHSQDGMIRDARSGGLSSREIITMSWLNDNVIGSLPAMEKLNEEAGAAVNVSGVSGVADKDETDRSSFAAAGHEGSEEQTL